MSWSISYASKAQFEQDEREETSSHPHSPEEVAQCNTLRLAAKQVIESATVAPTGGDVRVTLFGHASDIGSQTGGLSVLSK